jgi:hypothetical protein
MTAPSPLHHDLRVAILDYTDEFAWPYSRNPRPELRDIIRDNIQDVRILIYGLPQWRAEIIARDFCLALP